MDRKRTTSNMDLYKDKIASIPPCEFDPCDPPVEMIGCYLSYALEKRDDDGTEEDK